MSTIRVSECKRIMKYKKYLHLSLDTNPQKRIGGDFFSQLDFVFDKLEKYTEILEEFPKKKIIEIMIKRKQDGTIDNFIREFRTLKKILDAEAKGVEKKRIIANVKEYIRYDSPQNQTKTKSKTKSVTIDELYKKTASSAYIEEEILKTSTQLAKLLPQIKYSEVKYKTEFKKRLIDLVERIEKLIGI